MSQPSPALVALGRPRARDRMWIALGVLMSGILHSALAASVSALPDRPESAPTWLEMALVIEPETVAAPPPPPEPIPPAPMPPPEMKVAAVIPPQPEVARPVQGLSNDSFLPGSGSGFQVRAGHTTALPASRDIRPLDQPAEQILVPLAAVTQPPKARYKPSIEVPEAVKSAGLRGVVDLLLTIDKEGLVTDVDIVSSLSPEADAACVDATRRSRWKPGEQNGVAVVTLYVPFSCRFDQTVD